MGTTDINDTLVYIPLDDRPVDVDRVIYQAESAGLHMVMPDADLYKTRLDAQLKNSNGTQSGDCHALFEWLKTQDSVCNKFVISLDQILSGGLVNSRIQHNSDISFEQSVLDYIFELSENNEVYLIDTVMRLASTAEYYDFDVKYYEAFRAYAGKERYALNGSGLTVENIVAKYEYDKNNQIISHESLGWYNITLTDEEIATYLAARRRKLLLGDYLIKNIPQNGNIYCFIGIDDSVKTPCIQTNEINYLDTNAPTNVDVMGGTDEYGMMCIAKLLCDNKQAQTAARVRYYGGGEDYLADDYCPYSVKELMETHLDTLNVDYSENIEPELEILVLTQPSVQGNSQQYVTDLVNQIEYNIENNIPTIVTDGSDGQLPKMLQAELLSRIEISMLLGYSNWNTVSNAMGISLGQGFARYIYLTQGNTITQRANENFLKSMTFGFVKDMSYKTYMLGNMRTYVNNNIIKCADCDANNFYHCIQDCGALNATFTSMMLDVSYYGNPIQITDLLNSGRIITDLKSYRADYVGKVAVSGFNFGWYRLFECTFDINYN